MNPDFLNFRKHEQNEETEKVISKALDKERNKYLEVRKLKEKENAMKQFMPVTNVVTSVKKINVIQKKCITLGGSLCDENDKIVANLYGKPHVNNNLNFSSVQQNSFNSSITGNKMKLVESFSSSIGDNNSLNKSGEFKKIKDLEESKYQTCKCCGNQMPSGQTQISNLRQTTLFPNYVNCLNAFNGPLVNEMIMQNTENTSILLNEKGKVKEVAENERNPADEDIFCEYHLNKKSKKSFKSNHNDLQYIEESFGHTLCVKHKRLCKADTDILKATDIISEKANVHVHLDSYELHSVNTAFLNEKDRTSELLSPTEDFWKEQAKSILIKIGEQINVVNLDQKYCETKEQNVSMWAFNKWKHYTENNKIKKLRKENFRKSKEQILMRRYFSKWKNKITVIKKKKNERAEKIDLFIEVLKSKQKEIKQNNFKLRERKKKTTNYGGEFKHRLSVQKEIINIQKQKLAKAEEEMNKLKLKQILEETKTSKYIVTENIKDIIQGMNPSVRVTTNQLMSINKIKKTSDEKARTIVESMEARAKERKLKWQQIQERKKQKEDEKKELLQKQEAAKIHEEEENKKRKILEQKEQRKIEREQIIQKENERKRLASLNIIADNFYKKKLKVKALYKLQKNLRESLEKAKVAEQFYAFKLKQKTFSGWKLYVEESTTTKETLATHFYHYVLKRKVLDGFKEIYNLKILNLQVAIDFRDLKVQEKCFKKWRNICLWRQKIVQYQMTQADQFYTRNLLLKCLKSWRKLPEVSFHEREKEIRLRQWRDKVKEVLPDFVPFQFEESWVN